MKKLKLNELKVKSFVIDMDNANVQTIKGGAAGNESAEESQRICGIELLPPPTYNNGPCKSIVFLCE